MVTTEEHLEHRRLRRKRRKQGKGKRLKKAGYDRKSNLPFPWGMHYSSWCFNCRREIREYDLVQMGTFYDDEGRVDAFVHFDCRDHTDRPRVPRPEPNVHITREGVRRFTMATKAKKSRKSRKQKSEEIEDDQTTGQVNEEELEDEDEIEEDEEEAPKASKSKKSKKGKSKGGKEKSEKPKRESSGDPFPVSTGKLLVEALADAPKKLQVIAKALAGSKDVTHEQLVTLKEGIKAYAGTLRENEDNEGASALSALNSRVRRLERAAR